jgi:hypothetical protein
MQLDVLAGDEGVTPTTLDLVQHLRTGAFDPLEGPVWTTPEPARPAFVAPQPVAPTPLVQVPATPRVGPPPPEVLVRRFMAPRLLEPAPMAEPPEPRAARPAEADLGMVTKWRFTWGAYGPDSEA